MAHPGGNAASSHRGDLRDDLRMARVDPDDDSVEGVALSGYSPPPVLFRLARAAAHRAERTVSGERQWTANPRAREVDATIAAIVFAHAAVESAWQRAQMDAAIRPHEWPGEFDDGLAAVARARGLPPPDPLDPELRRRAIRIGAWRNFLQHGDEHSRRAIAALDEDPTPDQLTAELAREAVDVSRELLRRVGVVVGQDLGDTSWIDPLE